MALLGKGYARLLFLSILLILAALVGLNIYLNRKLDEQAPIYLHDFSGKLGYGLSVEDSYVDPLFRLRLRGVKIPPASPEGQPPLEIKSVTVNPSVFRSVFGGGIKIGEIYVDHPVIRYDGTLVRKLREFIEDRGEKDDDGREPAAVEIERIKIRDAVILASPGFSLSSGAMDILIVGGDALGSGEVTIDGDLTVGGVETEVSGSVLTPPGGSSGRFNITADRLKVRALPGYGDDSLYLSAGAELGFKAEGNIHSDGMLTLKAAEGEEAIPASGLRYSLNYDGSADTILIDALDFEVLDVVSGGFSGLIKDVSGDVVLDLSGSAERGDLSEIAEWLTKKEVSGISGGVKADDLKLSGSVKNNDVSLTGKFSLHDAAFTYGKDLLDVKGLDCRLGLKQDLSSGAGFEMSSAGDCSAKAVTSRDIGGLEDLSAGVRINGSRVYSVMDVKLAGLSASYMDGRVSGDAGLRADNGETSLTGRLAGEGLDLARVPDSVIPLDIEGSVRSVVAGFKGKSGAYAADISFAVDNFLVRSNAGREFRVSKASSGPPVGLEYISRAARVQDDGAGTEERGKIIIKDRGLKYEMLGFGDYSIGGGTVEDLLFTLEPGGEWTLGMSSRGEGFSVPGKDISLGRFSEHLQIDNSGRDGFNGTIEGRDGRFNGIDFPAVSADYEFKGDSLDITKLSADISTIGTFKTDKLGVSLGKGNGGYPYDIGFKDGVFSALDEKLKALGVSGSFTIFGPGSGSDGWKGTVGADKTSIYSETIEGLGMSVSPSPQGVTISGITGKLMGGALGGTVDILTSRSPSGINAGLGLTGSVVSIGGLDVNIGRAHFSFSGSLPSGGLPEGNSTLKLGDVKMMKNGAGSLFSGSLSARTSGETLFIEQGFIEDSEGNRLRFTGEMENTLGGPRKMEIIFPEAPLFGVTRIMAPYLPGTVREGQTGGTVSFRARLLNLFTPEQSWSGVVTLDSASYSGHIGGAPISLRDIDGTVNIKENSETGNRLAALLGSELELGRDVYKKYLRSFKEASRDSALDYLKIGEIEYGILKFENVECELDVDKNNLSIVRLVSGFFGGRMYVTGRYDYGGSYNFSLLFNDISLEGISRRLSPVNEYITGRINGLIWLDGEGGNLGTIDGPFDFWSVSSGKEERSIGKALLDKLGAKERFVLGSNRSYDSGEISGYINDGMITFKKFNISNSILGIQNLSIQADPVRNSITIAHLVSVIREIARRSQTGGPTIETN